MAVYYVDFQAENAGSGLSPEEPAKQLGFEKAGDIILFLRGRVNRMSISAKDGVTYGAYGDGENPVFSGSVNVSDPDMWEETEKCIWRCVYKTCTDAANFVFDYGKSYGTLRWEKKDLVQNGDFYDERFKHPGDRMENPDGALYLYCTGNPGEVYEDIECVLKENSWLMELANDITVENITFMNNGVNAVAGYFGAGNVTVRNCKFLNMGGSVWSRERRIRYGNCVEFWNVAENILVENCEFSQVYDSCVTHQGSVDCQVPVNVIFRNNYFTHYGMGAYEGRDRMPAEGYFTGNVCENAGCGFSMQGESSPRKSEIWPQPMGHHLFIWRINQPSEGGRLVVADNRFGDAPCGAAVYAIIAPEAAEQIEYRDNIYEGEFLIPDKRSL